MKYDIHRLCQRLAAEIPDSMLFPQGTPRIYRNPVIGGFQIKKLQPHI